MLVTWLYTLPSSGRGYKEFDGRGLRRLLSLVATKELKIPAIMRLRLVLLLLFCVAFYLEMQHLFQGRPSRATTSIDSYGRWTSIASQSVRMIHTSANREESIGTEYHHLRSKRVLAEARDRIRRYEIEEESPLVGSFSDTLGKHSLTAEDVEGIRRFVFFAGYERSGHSIIGSMLDAHPNIVLSTGFYLFKTMLSGKAFENSTALFNQLHSSSMQNAKEAPKNGRKGYTLDVPGLWQGNFTVLRVIGDKSASRTTMAYVKDPLRFKNIYQQLQHSIRDISIVVIHVVRNPYDMIGTHALYKASKERNMKLPATKAVKYNNTVALGKITKYFFAQAQAVANMIEACELTVLELRSEDIVRDSKGTLQTVCKALQVSCPEDYLQICHNKAFKHVSRSRDCVVWTPELHSTVQTYINKFPYFKGYTFDDDFYNTS